MKTFDARRLVYLRPCPAPEHLVTAYIYILRVFTFEVFATFTMLINNPFTILLAQGESIFRVEK